jgi:L-aspartate oxidase
LHDTLTLGLDRHLVPFDKRLVPQYRFDVVVVGSGAAGGFAALAAADAGAHVALVAKGQLSDGNTRWAKGGIAAVLDPADSFAQHVEDTLSVGCGLSDMEVVREVVEAGPRALQRLVDLGAAFDREPDGSLSLSKEGGHSQARIVHARGDSTGVEIQETIRRSLEAHPRVSLFPGHFGIDLLSNSDGRVVGLLCKTDRGDRVAFLGQEIVLATGGAGQIYRETTNPVLATGDGLAMGVRAGARVRDLEFTQFHPTCLYIAGAARVLISEIVRGAGGILRDRNGERFMPGFHPKAELAPRDVVSRAVFQRMVATEDTSVYLDLSAVESDPHVAFPTISRICRHFGIDIARDPIPVRPGMHYMVGGLAVDSESRCSVPGLWAVGECASTGVHGANRMGSNSLLEALVLGERCGRLVGTSALASSHDSRPEGPLREPDKAPPEVQLHVDDLTYSLKSMMWRQMGVERDGESMREAVDHLAFWTKAARGQALANPRFWELQNMLLVARLATFSALTREESRGVHFRRDFPVARDEWAAHIELVPEWEPGGLACMRAQTVPVIVPSSAS